MAGSRQSFAESPFLVKFSALPFRHLSLLTPEHRLVLLLHCPTEESENGRTIINYGGPALWGSIHT